MATIKRCFVISPIGPEGSPIRQTADDLFDLLIQPALEVFGFAVTRADRIVGSGQIGNEVIELVQNAELCIVDLSGHNPNVFYECGRRHETARPFIQLIKQGEALPFDLAGVRTLEYDLSDPRLLRRRIEDIRKYVEILEESGYGSSSSGATVSALAQTIDRLERKIDRLAVSGSTQIGGASHSIPVGIGLEGLLSNPYETFYNAFASGSIDQAALAFQQIRKLTTDKDRLITLAGVLATAGRREGAVALIDALGEATPDIEERTFSAGISALVRFYSITDTEPEGISVVEQLVQPKLAGTASPERKARLNNYLQMMYWGAKQYDDALRYGLEAIRLDPGESSYKSNVSMIYETKGMLAEAAAMADEFLAQDEEQPDPDHIGQAIDIYLAAGRLADVRTLFTRLSELDPVKANRKMVFDDDLRRAIKEGG